MTKQAAALIVAAGRGSRMAGSAEDLPKQYRDLGGQPVLTRTLSAFLAHADISKTAVVIHPDDHDLYARAVASLDPALKGRLLAPVDGGRTRQESVHLGLKALKRNMGPLPELVLIHDAARPFVTAQTISACLTALHQGAKAALTALPVFDTLKRASTPTGGHLETVDRENLWAAQTPQGFPFDLIAQAHDTAVRTARQEFTDDTGLAEWAGHPVTLTPGDPKNFKITTQEDLRRAASLLKTDPDIMTAPVSASAPQKNDSTSPTGLAADLAALGDVRHGQGYDVHAFEDGDAVILGGVPIAHSKRLKGHSDADVVLHALTDAIFGALAYGDIGSHFPPSDPQWKGAASDQFLIHALDRLAARGGRLAHADVTIVCEEPKIGPVRDTIRASIAEICKLPLHRVSVKATTSERLGFTGRREGIACLASATIRLPFGAD